MHQLHRMFFFYFNRAAWQEGEAIVSINMSFVLIKYSMISLHSMRSLRKYHSWCRFVENCNLFAFAYLLTLPLVAGVSRVRALSPAWTGSRARETLISRTRLFLPHDLPPTKKSSTIKSWPTFCDQYFWKFPIWNSCADEKRREIRMVKVFKWYPVIDLFDTFTGKLGHGD